MFYCSVYNKCKLIVCVCMHIFCLLSNHFVKHSKLLFADHPSIGQKIAMGSKKHRNCVRLIQVDSN